MQLSGFKISPQNVHYEGSYSPSEMHWRRICAADKAKNIQSLLPSNFSGSVLEVGCGTGAVLAALAKHQIGTRHVGVDVTDPLEHAEPSALQLDLRTFDGVTLPFESRSFDLVFASHVVEHVLHPRAFLLELQRVSRHLLYVEVPCELHKRATHKSLQAGLDIGHINPFSRETFLLLLQSTGLEVEKLQLFDHSLAVYEHSNTNVVARAKHAIKSGLLALSPTLAEQFFTYHCGAIARCTN
ncbi:MAG: class I SAM-dependent methyltransferase [Rhodocyclaceae bacterium]|jgi:SAM-dependent methyltransferase|nr:class I SAM-dependent methyltransferase [Rhodocyclaceae bacterium]MCA3059068.1 class I SAM-dependent methyltransferase [Rhodocyclaceae bacterium]MCA3082436.1 class I SAM-dependent methyltransferase [Rhodocyclaceae bacterium]MCE2723085.1 class I SAM-dependent methyltransferase [Betaproteobacteria bacterium]